MAKLGDSRSQSPKLAVESGLRNSSLTAANPHTITGPREARKPRIYVETEKILGYEFKRSPLLGNALQDLDPPRGHPERIQLLHFIGSPVLTLAVVDLVTSKLPAADKRSIGQAQNALSNPDRRWSAAESSGFLRAIGISPADKKSKGKLADQKFKALLGAIMLDSSFEDAGAAALSFLLGNSSHTGISLETPDVQFNLMRSFPDYVWERFETILGHTFSNHELRDRALLRLLRHREEPSALFRLEFLGREVINLYISNWLREQKPKSKVSSLLKERSWFANNYKTRRTEAGGAFYYALKEFRRDFVRPSTDAFLLRGIVGAIFKDAGYQAAAAAAARIFESPRLKNSTDKKTTRPIAGMLPSASRDPKAWLEERLHPVERTIDPVTAKQTKGGRKPLPIQKIPATGVGLGNTSLLIAVLRNWLPQALREEEGRYVPREDYFPVLKTPYSEEALERLGFPITDRFMLCVRRKLVGEYPEVNQRVSLLSLLTYHTVCYQEIGQFTGQRVLRGRLTAYNIHLPKGIKVDSSVSCDTLRQRYQKSLELISKLIQVSVLNVPEIPDLNDKTINQEDLRKAGFIFFDRFESRCQSWVRENRETPLQSNNGNYNAAELLDYCKHCDRFLQQKSIGSKYVGSEELRKAKIAFRSEEAKSSKGSSSVTKAAKAAAANLEILVNVLLGKESRFKLIRQADLSEHAKTALSLFPDECLGEQAHLTIPELQQLGISVGSDFEAYLTDHLETHAIALRHDQEGNLLIPVKVLSRFFQRASEVVNAIPGATRTDATREQLRSFVYCMGVDTESTSKSILLDPVNQNAGVADILVQDTVNLRAAIEAEDPLSPTTQELTKAGFGLSSHDQAMLRSWLMIFGTDALIQREELDSRIPIPVLKAFVEHSNEFQRFLPGIVRTADLACFHVGFAGDPNPSGRISKARLNQQIESNTAFFETVDRLGRLPVAIAKDAARARKADVEIWDGAGKIIDAIPGQQRTRTPLMAAAELNKWGLNAGPDFVPFYERWCRTVNIQPQKGPGDTILISIPLLKAVAQSNKDFITQQMPVTGITPQATKDQLPLFVYYPGEAPADKTTKANLLSVAEYNLTAVAELEACLGDLAKARRSPEQGHESLKALREVGFALNDTGLALYHSWLKDLGVSPGFSLKDEDARLSLTQLEAYAKHCFRWLDLEVSNKVADLTSQKIAFSELSEGRVRFNSDVAYGEWSSNQLIVEYCSEFGELPPPPSIETTYRTKPWETSSMLVEALTAEEIANLPNVTIMSLQRAGLRLEDGFETFMETWLPTVEQEVVRKDNGHLVIPMAVVNQHFRGALRFMEERTGAGKPFDSYKEELAKHVYVFPHGHGEPTRNEIFADVVYNIAALDEYLICRQELDSLAQDPNMRYQRLRELQAAGLVFNKEGEEQLRHWLFLHGHRSLVRDLRTDPLVPLEVMRTYFSHCEAWLHQREPVSSRGIITKVELASQYIFFSKTEGRKKRYAKAPIMSEVQLNLSLIDSLLEPGMRPKAEAASFDSKQPWRYAHAVLDSRPIGWAEEQASMSRTELLQMGFSTPPGFPKFFKGWIHSQFGRILSGSATDKLPLNLGYLMVHLESAEELLTLQIEGRKHIKPILKSLREHICIPEDTSADRKGLTNLLTEIKEQRGVLEILMHTNEWLTKRSSDSRIVSLNTSKDSFGVSLSERGIEAFTSWMEVFGLEELANTSVEGIEIPYGILDTYLNYSRLHLDRIMARDSSRVSYDELEGLHIPFSRRKPKTQSVRPEEILAEVAANQEALPRLLGASAGFAFNYPQETHTQYSLSPLLVDPGGPEKDLWQSFKQGGSEQAKHLLWCRYQDYVDRIAKKLKSVLSPKVDVEDLFSAGQFGLNDALDEFDPSRGIYFSTFAYQRVKGAMLDELRAMDPASRLMRVRQGIVAEAAEQFETRHGRYPDDEELFEAINESRKEDEKVDLAEFKRIYADAQAVGEIELDAPRFGSKGEDEVSFKELQTDNRVLEPHEALDWGTINTIIRMLKNVSRAERTILTLFYTKGMVMKEVADSMDISESRVSQMHSVVMERAKKHPQLRALFVQKFGMNPVEEAVEEVVN